MVEFTASDSGGEVIGQVIVSFVAAFPPELKDIGSKILDKHGIHNLEPKAYYPLQAWLDAIKEINESFGPQMLFRIGEQVAFHAVLPSGINSLEEALQSIDTAYKMNHRVSENIGSYTYSKLDEESGLQKGKMVCDNPYPSAFDRGTIEGFAKRFKPKDCKDIIVTLDESQPSRTNGGNSCTYIISWY